MDKYNMIGSSIISIMVDFSESQNVKTLKAELIFYLLLFFILYKFLILKYIKIIIFYF
jgi:hypothetical protein